MQLEWDEHFYEIVIPAWQAYRNSERRLSEAVEAKDHQAVREARYNALREAGAACFYVHHFADLVLRARPHWLPAEIKTVQPLLDWLSSACTGLRSENQCADVNLLRDVAESLKHAILTRRLADRQVAANEAVIIIGTGYGELPYGEGKFGGGLQVVVVADAGPRALSSVLQNVIDAWRRVSGQPLPEIGQP